MRLLALLALLLAACSSQNPHQGEPAPADASKYDELVIVGTNDFHGYLRPVETEVEGQKIIQGGAEWFAGYADILQRKFGDHLLLLDAGDMYQGTMDSNMAQGRSVELYYNMLPYRALAVGNHEFDYGPGSDSEKDRLHVLKTRIAESAHPFVAANIFVKKTGKRWQTKNLFPSVLVSAGPYKVGIIGLSTVTTPAKTSPVNVATLEFRDFVAPAVEQAKKLRDQGADLVVVTTHEGDGAHPGDAIDKFLHEIPAGTVDALVAGHTHTESHQLVNGVPVIESKTRGEYFGRIDLFVNKETRKLEPSLTRIHEMHWICGTWFKNYEHCGQKDAKDAMAAGKVKASDLFPLRPAMYEGEVVKRSQAVHDVVAPYIAKAEDRRKEVLGVAKVDFDWYPSGENQMGTLLADAFHDRFPEAKVVDANGGGLRRRIFKGPITYGDLYEVNPFDNLAVLVKMNGKQLKEIIKVQVSGAQSVPIVRGIKVNYFNRKDDHFLRDVNGDGKKEKWEQDRLLPNIGVIWEKTGKPVGDNETFWVATIDYLVNGGDNLAHVYDQIPQSRKKYFDISPRDVMAEYLRKHPGIELPHVDMQRLNGIKGPGADVVIDHH